MEKGEESSLKHETRIQMWTTFYDLEIFFIKKNSFSP